jgi:hypothetical protein
MLNAVRAEAPLEKIDNATMFKLTGLNNGGPSQKPLHSQIPHENPIASIKNQLRPLKTPLVGAEPHQTGPGVLRGA